MHLFSPLVFVPASRKNTSMPLRRMLQAIITRSGIHSVIIVLLCVYPVFGFTPRAWYAPDDRSTVFAWISSANDGMGYNYGADG